MGVCAGKLRVLARGQAPRLAASAAREDVRRAAGRDWARYSTGVVGATREIRHAHAGKPYARELQEGGDHLGVESFLRVDHGKIAYQPRRKWNLDKLPE